MIDRFFLKANMAISLTLMLATPAQANSGSKNKKTENHHITCQQILDKPGPLFMNTESVPGSDAQDLKKAAEIVTQIAHDLGLATPPHQVNLVPSDQLNIMATTGGHAAPHWTDGSSLVKSLSQSMGVLEFVTPGCPTCRGYYSASTPFVEQVSVLMHVMGHNDMAVNSLYSNTRPGDGPWSALHLAKRLTEAYRTVDHDQVSLYFQFLKSTSHLQDYVFGTFEEPEKFNAKKMQDIPAKPGQSIFESLTPEYLERSQTAHPWVKTPSILQFLVKNLPDNSPNWQKDLVTLFEQSHRLYPAIFNNKIMNEGWATLMQYIIARHSPWNTSNYNVTFAQLLSGVAYPSFKNPYWLGLSGWNNLYEEFRERPEMQDLSEFEKDKRFIAWARNMYAGKNDSEWARVAINERWIRKMNLLLYRPITYEELDPAIPQEKQTHIVLSRDWKRIQNYIIRTYVDTKYLFRPSFQIRNPSQSRKVGTIELEQDKTSQFPLEIVSASKTLYVLTQILQKPVSLKGLFYLPIKTPPPPPFSEDDPWSPAHYPRPPWLVRKPVIQREVLSVVLTVEPQGTVSLRGVTDEAHEKILSAEAFSNQLEGAIDLFKKDVLKSFHKDLLSFRPHQWDKLKTAVSDQAVANVADIIYFAPSTNPAVREYLDLIEIRLRGRLEDAISGKAPIQFQSKGVGINILPEIPELRYDFRYINQFVAAKPPAPIDKAAVVSSSIPFDIDDNGTEISPGRLLPGDRFGKKPNNQGQGDGEGEEGEEGEESDEEADGPGEGEGQGSGGGNPPTDMVVPLELYGELLSEMLELPNIRRTEGNEKDFNHIRRGSAHRTNGHILWDQTLMMAVEKARALRKSTGKPYDSSVPMLDLLHEAVKLIEPTDYYVADEMLEPVPDFDAVLVVSVDMTGSMYGDRIKTAKNLLYNLKALLKAKYKNVVIRYIAFSDHAVEMTEKDIFSKFMGGGTAYAPAVQKSAEILREYPNSRYNKYILTIGDGETMDGEDFAHEIDQLKDDLQYAGYAATNTYQAAAGVIAPLQKLKSNWPWMGITNIAQSSQIFNALKELFPKSGAGKD